MAKEVVPMNGHVHLKVYEKEDDGTEKVIRETVSKI